LGAVEVKLRVRHNPAILEPPLRPEPTAVDDLAPEPDVWFTKDTIIHWPIIRLACPYLATNTRVKQNALYFMQKDAQPSEKSSGGHIIPNPTQNRCGLCLFAYGEYKPD